MIRIAIVEDIESIREGIAYLINSSTEMNVIHSFSNAEDLIESLSVSSKSLAPLPHIVLMDIQLPGINGIEATRIIKKDYPKIEIMMLTIFEDEEKIFKSIKAGAKGYILKDTPRRSLISEIIELYNGGSPMTPRIARKILDDFTKEKGAKQNTNYKLSKREKEILKLIVDGLTYIEIADKVSIRPNTVRKHIQNIYEKLQVNSRAEVVGKAIYEGLI